MNPATDKTRRQWSEALRQARRRKGQSLEHAARAIGVCARTVFRWEHKQSMPQGLQQDALKRYVEEG